MANTLSTDLIADIISEKYLTTAQNRVPDFGKFATDFSAETMAIVPGQGAKSTIQVPLATAGATTLVNPSNFENGDVTIAAKPVSMDQYTQPMHLTNSELQAGHRLERAVGISLATLLNRLWTKVQTNITAANFGAAILDKDPATVVAADLKTIFAACDKFSEKNLTVNSTFYSQFLPTNRESFDPTMPGAYGFDSWNLASDFSSAGDNVCGFVSGPEAIAMAARLPEHSSKVAEVISQSLAELPNGLTIAVNNWVSTGSRAEWASLDIIFGAAPGDAESGKIIEDGTT